MKEWAEDSTAGCEASGLFDEDEGSSHGQRMMSGEQGLELSGAARNGGCVICPSDGESALLRRVRRGRSQVMRDSPVQG
jgi:hypothetical protein